ncbi:hypothetical protein DCS_02457 [Drechmeria coniospora]|uniref:phosphatidylinositol-3,4,5-trisphosphate 3-phosphatase n=1 Tax=Drechmeria coniospora TaxID=98403 RepID=A0A151GW23_DRECN|nr:hypothetical protein DCS_02457 [Drechmeria coniospora]KYK61315.1 hypothetical protein DCS_02457 [Drechmeria coniospora]ODA81079.1 hypothetical protein RJ55_04042 [Drechmeria coniospora]
MSSILRQIVAGPRARHPEAGLDLCYVTDFIIATSGPSQTYPQRAYRNPLDQLVAFLDSKHGVDWAIWEFRAEGTGYPDEAVYDRIRHYPWPDHHPPPFRLVPMIMASMRNWLHGGDLESGKMADKESDPSPAGGSGSGSKNGNRVVVVHCKAGKGRSGTAACSYLISEEGWTADDALARFTQRRMRPKFGAGVSIPSQLRWVSYVDRWTRNGKKYVDRPIEILEIHLWGLRIGVRVDVEAFEHEGRKIKILHTFSKEERVVVQGGAPPGGGLSDLMWELAGYPATGDKVPDAVELADAADGPGTATPPATPDRAPTPGESTKDKFVRKGADLLQKAAAKGEKRRAKAAAVDANQLPSSGGTSADDDSDEHEAGGMAVILRPSEPILVPNSDVNISVERRNRTHKSMGLTMVSAVAHVWFNAFFEGDGPEQNGAASDSGVFTIEWDAMDGIKGSSRKGSRALDRLAVVWRVASPGEDIPEPPEGAPVPQLPPADWKGDSAGDETGEKDLGLRAQSPASTNISRASSLRSADGVSGAAKLERRVDGDGGDGDGGDGTLMEGLRCSGPAGEDILEQAQAEAKDGKPVDTKE